MFPDGGTDAAKIQSFPVSTVDPSSGQVLVYNSTTRQWEPSSGMAPLSGGTFSGNVTLNGTANTAPNQTAASGSSFMTRDLVDSRSGFHYFSVNSFLFRDYFIGGGQSSGTIGQLGWSSNSSAIGAVAGTATERAAVSISTGSASGNNCRMRLYPGPLMTTSGAWRMEIRLKLSSVSAVKIALGYSNTVGMTLSGGVLARFDSATDTYWTVISAASTQASATAPTTNWTTIVLRSPDGGETQYLSIDGGAETSLSASRGSTGSNFMLYVETSEAVAKTVSVNFFEMLCT